MATWERYVRVRVRVRELGVRELRVRELRVRVRELRVRKFKVILDEKARQRSLLTSCG